MNVITIDNVCKNYNTKKALDNKGFITEFEELNLNQSLHIPE